jgi:hypothetical protein
MSVGDSFTLVPLSNFFVKRTGTLPGTNIGSIFPIASGRIEQDGVNIDGGVTGNYTWYPLSHYEGTPSTQGKEFREYLLVIRGLSATSSTAIFQLFIPEGGFTPGYFAYRPLYEQTSATTSGGGTHTWTIGFPSQTKVQLDTSTPGFTPSNESFFFYIMGI